MTLSAGRFAPSPTGPLHHGSLLAATASFLDARQHGLRWLLRIDDLDTPRMAQGAEATILRALQAHGLHWDGDVVRQSARTRPYQAALDRLEAGHLLYRCTCTRSQLAGHPIYPGTCRTRRVRRADAALRLRVEATPVHFDDLIQGWQTEILTETCGDFVVRRRDGLIAYQLATAVDDGSDEITRVVRGGDLLDNTARQIFLMEKLGLSIPAYAHLPVLVDDRGQKLSKQTHAPGLDDERATANLLAVFGTLALSPPAAAAGWSPETLLRWALERFSLGAIQGGAVTFHA